MNSYKRYFPILLITTIFIVMYFQVIVKMIHEWSSNDNYSHGFLIPFIAGYIIWENREKLRDIKISPSNSGLLLFILSIAFFIITNIGAEVFTMRASMILVIFSSVIFVAGWELARAVFLPVSYLIFMIPFPAIIWNKIAFPLKIFATKCAVDLIKLIGITVFSEGNIIHLSNTILEVVDACSGLRSLTSLIALSAAFALLSKLSTPKKIIVFLSAIPIAILLNIVRLTSTAVLARHYGPDVAHGFLHDFSGIVVFIVAFILLFSINTIFVKFEKVD